MPHNDAQIALKEDQAQASDDDYVDINQENEDLKDKEF